MRIYLLGSMKFLPQKQLIASYLKSLGHEIDYSHQDTHDMEPSKAWKQKLMRAHMKRIEWSDAVIILNLPKEVDLDFWVDSFIDGSTLGEIFIAWYLGKQIYSWFEIPRGHPYFEELDCMGIKVWKDRDLCRHSHDVHKKLSRNYEICTVCGNVKRL